MSFWDIATMRYSGLSYPTDIQEMSICVKSYKQNKNILKYHMEVRNMLLFHYYIMKMNYF